MTQGHYHVFAFEEAEALIAQLRLRVDHFSSQVEALTREREQWRNRATHLAQVKDSNERLRGVVIRLQQKMGRYLTPNKISAFFA